MEFNTINSIRSKYERTLAFLTKKSFSSFKKILTINGGTVVKINIRLIRRLLSIRMLKHISKTMLIKIRIEPTNLLILSVLPLILISRIKFTVNLILFIFNLIHTVYSNITIFKYNYGYCSKVRNLKYGDNIESDQR